MRWFQSTPGISAGRYVESGSADRTSVWFQSTPGISAGRYPGRYWMRRRTDGFNPLPAFLPGDTRRSGIAPGGWAEVSIHSRHFCREIPQRRLEAKVNEWVSIHSRHFCREIPPDTWTSPREQGVSIHSRHFCREILVDGLLAKAAMPCFNPLPAFLPGDTLARSSPLVLSSCFNPLPAFLPGDTSFARYLRRPNRVVSIHSRHFCREIPISNRGQAIIGTFQSTPGISAGRYVQSSSPCLAPISVSIHSRH